MSWFDDQARGISDPHVGRRGTASPPAIGTEAWARERRQHKVGDALGQQVHEILWSPVAPDDLRAQARRIDALRSVFQSLTPAEARQLLERLDKGDLAADFRYRLSTPSRAQLVAILEAARARLNQPTPGARSTSTAPPASPQPKPSGPLSAGEQAFLKSKIAAPIKLGSRRIFSRRVGNLALFGTISGELKLTVVTPTRANLEVYTELSGKGVEEVEVTVANAIFGADGHAKVERNKDGTYAFSLGVDIKGISIDFSPNLLSPVTIELPPMTLKIASLKQRIPALKLDGSADLVVSLTFEIVPDYAKAAKLMADAGKSVGSVIRRGVHNLGQKAVRLRGAVARAITSGRRAWGWLVEKALERVGKKIAKQWADDLATLGSRASMKGAAAKVARRFAGRVLGALGLWMTIQETRDQLVDAVLKAQRDEARRKMLVAFRVGYATMLLDLTKRDWKSWFETVRTRGVPHEVWTKGPPKTVEHWVQLKDNKVDASELDKWLKTYATKPERTMVALAEDDWHQRLIESEVAFMFATRTRDPAATEVTKRVAHEHARIAGEAACYQDVIQFLGAHADPEMQRAGLSAEQQWTAVGVLHDAIYPTDDYSRQVAYQNLIEFHEVLIPPFSH